jgi:single-stranded-DNA-specific exonuclease
MEWIEPSPIDSPAPLPDLHPLVAQTLLRRGLRTPAAAIAFLDPQAYSPTPAASLPGLTSIVDRLEAAILAREPVCVWGDFDADGQTSTTILVQTLQDLHADVVFHIPVRENESHGVNKLYLQEIIDRGAKLILTCDTGISTPVEVVDYAHSRGVDMLITDHHNLPESLPKVTAITNTKLLPLDHPLSTLSGSGVAYKLAEELYARFGRPGEANRQLDLATLGLVADLARLTGDARYLVQRGLEALRNPQRLGLQIIMEVAELAPANLTEEHIGFVLAPRLNALGRLADANPAVELLSTSDPVRARVLATQLEGLNTQRQLLCNQVTRAAEAQLREDPSLLAQPVLVLGHPTWPGGVVGIVASRLVDRYHKPAILFSTPDGQPARGSARSVEGLNITAAISAQKELLLNFGGHPMAAGLSLDKEKLDEFRRRLSSTVTEMMQGIQTESSLEIDGWLTLPEASMELAAALESLAPYGPGNEKLILATSGLKIQSKTSIGRNQEHLKLNVTDEAGNSRTVLWWNGAGEKDTLPESRIDLAYSLRASDWRGTPQVQMEFVDFRNLAGQPVEVKTSQYEVIDYRNASEPSQILSTLREQSSTLVWAEGQEKKRIGGRDRFELAPAESLAIWTIPPSLHELRLAMEMVHPRKVYLFAVNDPIEKLDDFLAKLAGLLKYAINHRSGRITWSALETATLQRSVTVRRGLAWLVSQGIISIQSEEDDNLTVKAVTIPKDRPDSTNLKAEIQSLLDETAAYRQHFKHAGKDNLFSSSDMPVETE